MATEQKIKIYQIASTSIDYGLAEWLKQFGIESEEGTGSERVVGYAAKGCYKSFRVGLNLNVTRVRTDWKSFFDNILRSGHGSVLEHATYTYAIEGCTRVFTAEMNRHRAGVAISERSMRYVRFNDIAYWLPTSIDIDVEGFVPESSDQFRAMTHTRSLFREVFEFIEKKYGELERIWGIEVKCNNCDGMGGIDPTDHLTGMKGGEYCQECDGIGVVDGGLPFAEKKALTSMFRRIVPMGCSTGVVYTFNLRALRHILMLRTSKHAEEEIRHVCCMVLDDIVQREPLLMGLMDECQKV